MSHPNIDAIGRAAYGVKARGLPPMDRPQPSVINFRQREKKDGRPKGLYMEAKTLNQWRRVRGLAVDELAELTGVGMSIESYLYRGSEPRVELGLKFASVLGVDVEQIIWGKPEKVDKASLPPMPKSPPYDPRTRTPVISDEQMEVMVQWAEAGMSKRDIHEAMGVSRQTFYTALEKYEALHGPVLFAQARAKPNERQGKKPAKKEAKPEPSRQRRKAAKAVL